MIMILFIQLQTNSVEVNKQFIEVKIEVNIELSGFCDTKRITQITRIIKSFIPNT